MEAVGFIVVMAAIAMLLRWLITHDKTPNAPTTGPFALREPDPGVPAKAARGAAPAPGMKPPARPPAKPARPPMRRPGRPQR
jgi:hypothetical protein